MDKPTSDDFMVGDKVEPIKDGWNETFVVKKILNGFNNQQHLRSVVFEEGGFMPIILLRKVKSDGK